MFERQLHDGRNDGLIPLESFKLDELNTLPDLLRAMGKTAFGGRQLGEAFEIIVEMSKRPTCQVVLTLSGAMTVAKQGQLICDMIDRGLVHAVVATGALIAHGLTESIGLTHYRYDPKLSDEALFRDGYNRVYDTLEMEANLNDVESLVRSILEGVTPPDGVWSSARLCHALGRHLDEMDEGPGILRSAFQRQIPVYIPAFTDSEIGLDVATWSIQQSLLNKDPSTLTAEEVFRSAPSFNPFLDLQEYAQFVGRADELGILTIGGGVPRNWAQQIAPFIDVVNLRIGSRLRPQRFKYGVRICPEPAHWGGLSGCTYSEGVSWGKFTAPRDGGRFAEVLADATVVWPLLMKAVFLQLDS